MSECPPALSWILTENLLAWKAAPCYAVYDGTICLMEKAPSFNGVPVRRERFAFMYVDENMRIYIDNSFQDLGDDYMLFLGIWDYVEENRGKLTTIDAMRP